MSSPHPLPTDPATTPDERDVAVRTPPAAEPDEAPDRTAGQAWPYLASALAFLVAPFLVAAFLPASTATVALLVLLPLAAVAVGFADGRVFRATWAFPILTGLMCWVGLQLYTNPGTWIYAVGVLLLCLAGSWLGGRRAAKG